MAKIRAVFISSDFWLERCNCDIARWSRTIQLRYSCGHVQIHFCDVIPSWLQRGMIFLSRFSRRRRRGRWRQTTTTTYRAAAVKQIGRPEASVEPASSGDCHPSRRLRSRRSDRCPRRCRRRPTGRPSFLAVHRRRRTISDDSRSIRHA